MSGATPLRRAKRQPTETSNEVARSIVFYSQRACRRDARALYLLSSLTALLRRLIVALLLASGSVHPNPGPHHQRTQNNQTSSFLQFNCNGIRSSAVELSVFIKKHNVIVAAIQETKLNPASRDPKFDGFVVVRRDRARDRGGGLLFLVHHALSYIHVNLDNVYPNCPCVELQGISVIVDNKPITIVNLYVPPASSCPPSFSFDIGPLLDFLDGGDALVLGDANAHHDSWFSTLHDPRGDALSLAIDSSPFISINADTPTRLPPNGSPSSPDISLVTAHLATSFSWSTSTTLNSDHLPILISILDSIPPVRPTRSFINFKLARWRDFREEVERRLDFLPTPSSCDRGEKAF